MKLVFIERRWDPCEVSEWRKDEEVTDSRLFMWDTTFQLPSPGGETLHQPERWFPGLCPGQYPEQHGPH